MSDIDEWRGKVGESWAREWQRTDRSFSNFTDTLIDAMAAEPYSNVLDVGCGAGEVSLRLADREPEACICGVDISSALLETARQRSAGRANIQFYLANAAQWQPEGGTAPDLIASRHGVMFFDDPIAAFTNLRAMAAFGARLVFSCFRSLKFNPFFTEIGTTLPPPETTPDPHAPGPFAFADQARVRSILAGAGWRDITFEPVDFQMVAGKGTDPVAEALEYFQRIGPAARILREADDAQRGAILTRIEDIALRNCVDGVVSMQAGVWIVRARVA